MVLDFRRGGMVSLFLPALVRVCLTKYHPPYKQSCQATAVSDYRSAEKQVTVTGTRCRVLTGQQSKRWYAICGWVATQNNRNPLAKKEQRTACPLKWDLRESS